MSRCTSRSWKSRSVTPVARRTSAARLFFAVVVDASLNSNVRTSDTGRFPPPMHET